MTSTSGDVLRGFDGEAGKQRRGDGEVAGGDDARARPPSRRRRSRAKSSAVSPDVPMTTWRPAGERHQRVRLDRRRVGVVDDHVGGRCERGVERRPRR